MCSDLCVLRWQRRQRSQFWKIFHPALVRFRAKPSVCGKHMDLTKGLFLWRLVVYTICKSFLKTRLCIHPTATAAAEFSIKSCCFLYVNLRGKKCGIYCWKFCHFNCTLIFLSQDKKIVNISFLSQNKESVSYLFKKMFLTRGGSYSLTWYSNEWYFMVLI